jgi:hypothetical protein
VHLIATPNPTSAVPGRKATASFRPYLGTRSRQRPFSGNPVYRQVTGGVFTVSPTIRQEPPGATSERWALHYLLAPNW